MKKQFKILIFSCVIVCLLLTGCQSQNRSDEILQEVSAVVESYPALPETYQSAVMPYYSLPDGANLL